MRHITTLHRIHVIGSGLPTTETPGWPAGLPCCQSAPCELNGRCDCPANTNLRLDSLRTGAASIPVKGRCGQTHTPAHCPCSTGLSLQVRLFFQAQTLRERAARPPSSRQAARLLIRCITARSRQRYRWALTTDRGWCSLHRHSLLRSPYATHPMLYP